MPLADIPVVYVIGAPRSGTTWFQLMLGSHPKVATPIELDFFSTYVDSWYETWEDQRLARGRAGRPNWGLPAVLTQDEFVETVRTFVEQVYRRVLVSKPGSEVMVEKDPRYFRFVDTIVRTVPHAKFVHVLRDGRDVACSMTRVSESWGRDWAPSTVSQAALLWRSAVEGCLDASQAPGGYLEVRYEDLLSDAGPGLLATAFEFCGVEATGELVDSIYERYRAEGSNKDVLSGGLTWSGEAVESEADVSFPADFVGPATAGHWRRVFSMQDREAFDSVAGGLLHDLGYEPDRSWAGGKAAAWSPIPTRR
jgi:Sulfotransferase family